MNTMTTTPQRRVRQLNLYTVTADGEPVAQCEAISQSDAVALYLAAQQQPAMSARLATPREARAFAHLPLYSRTEQAEPVAAPEPERDPRAPEMFDGIDDPPTAEVIPALLAVSAAVARESAAAALAAPAPLQEEPAAEPLGEPAPQEAGASAEDGADLDDVLASTGDAYWRDVRTLTTDDLCAAYGRGRADRAAGRTIGEMPEEYFGRALTKDWREGWRAEDRDIANEVCGISREQWGEQSNTVTDPPTKPSKPDDSKPKAKYRDPNTGSTWTGRGLKPRWLTAAIDAGRSVDEFLIA